MKDTESYAVVALDNYDEGGAPTIVKRGLTKERAEYLAGDKNSWHGLDCPVYWEAMTEEDADNMYWESHKY